MLEKENTFKHQSLQDKNSIQDMLKSIGKALSKGELTFKDQKGEIVLEPKGLLDVKVIAKKHEGQQQVELSISWKTDDKRTSSSLQIK